MAPNYPSKTANDCIRNAEAAIAHIAGQLSEEALRDIAAVVATCKATFALDELAGSHKQFRDGNISRFKYERILDEAERATAVAQAALRACGVEVNREG